MGPRRLTKKEPALEWNKAPGLAVLEEHWEDTASDESAGVFIEN
jgi:hypothetical protein